MSQSVGMLEVQGYSVALAAIDKACKSADIKILGIECNNPKSNDQAHIPVVIQVKFIGNIDDVKTALEISFTEASKYIPREDIFVHQINSTMSGLEKLLETGKVKIK